MSSKSKEEKNEEAIVKMNAEWAKAVQRDNQRWAEFVAALPSTEVQVAQSRAAAAQWATVPYDIVDHP